MYFIVYLDFKKINNELSRRTTVAANVVVI